MQIQQQVSRTIGTKEYIKSWVVISQKKMKELGWKKGDVLDDNVVDNKLVIDLKKD